MANVIPDQPIGCTDAAARTAAPSGGAGTHVPLADVLKTVAAQCIVVHHLSAYGPMSQAVQAHAGGAIEFAYDYGRAAVFVFLVLGGFLAAGSLMPAPGRRAAIVEAGSTVGLVVRRWLRLGWPYWFALLAAVGSAEVARRAFVDEDTPAAPGLQEFLANALMLQDIVGVAALSAGVWYVAIDLQLYGLFAAFARSWAACRALLPGALRPREPFVSFAAVGILCAAIIAGWLVFGQDDALDVWAVYFFGAYGIGVLVRWGRSAADGVGGDVNAVRTGETAARDGRGRSAPWLPRAGSSRWWLLIGGLCALALIADPRVRTVVTAATALALLSGWSASWMRHPVFRWGARTSYAVFLIHYPVSLLANAVVYRAWGDDLAANACGLVGAWLASNLAGWFVYRFVEARAPRFAG